MSKTVISKKEGYNKGLIFALLGMFGLTLIFWNTIYLYPIKLFVVLAHEISHGIAAVVTGGSIVKIEISEQIGGACYTRGGLRLAVLPAGYLGSIIWGGLILTAASRTKADKAISVIIGLFVAAITLLFIRNAFGFIFGGCFGAIMVLLGIFAPMRVNDFILKFLGITSIGYAIIDIKDDLISRTVAGSDAYKMAEIIPLPPVVWGIIWIIIAIVSAVFFLKMAARSKPDTEKTRKKTYEYKKY